MKNINELCQIIEENVPKTRCTIHNESNQISVEFTNRLDVVIHLLTPYYQNCLKKGGIADEDLKQLIFEVRKISGYKE